MDIRKILGAAAFLAFALVVATTSFGTGDWTDSWSTGWNPADPGVTTGYNRAYVRSGTSTNIIIPSTADSGDFSEVVAVTSEVGVICVDTSIGAGAGAVTLELFRAFHPDSITTVNEPGLVPVTNSAGAVILATAAPCEQVARGYYTLMVGTPPSGTTAVVNVTGV